MFNRLNNNYISRFADMSKKEFVVGYLFCLITIFFGLKPSSILDIIEHSIYNYLIFKI